MPPTPGEGRPELGAALPLTGERTVPAIPAENYWFRRHEVVYEWASSQLRALESHGEPTVLDAGCGEGYGLEIFADALRSHARKERHRSIRHEIGSIVGLELDVGAASHAHGRYGASGKVEVVQANLDAFPIAASTVDLLVSLQVIEHLWDLSGFLSECARVLRNTGIAILSTPNRITFSPGLERNQRPTNPFHVEEFDAAQLIDLVQRANLAQVHCYGVHHGPRITRWEDRHGSIVDTQVLAATNPSAVDSTTAEALSAFVESVTASDFSISATDLDRAQDLIVVSGPLDLEAAGGIPW